MEMSIYNFKELENALAAFKVNIFGRKRGATEWER